MSLNFYEELKSQPAPLLHDSLFVVQVSAAIDSVYNLNFAAAREILDQAGVKETHPLFGFWEAWEIWWTLLQDLSSDQNDDTFFSQLDKAERIADSWLETNPDHLDALMAKTLVNAFGARLASNRGKWILAMKKARNAQLTLYEIERVEPHHPDLLFSEGMLNYYFELVPERFPSTKVFMWAIPNGDKELGLAQLDSALALGTFLPNESAYFLANIHAKYERKYETAAKYAKILVQKFPNNGFYMRFGIRIFFQAKKYSDAKETIAHTLSTFTDSTTLDLLSREYAHLFAGRLATIENDSKKAKSAFAASYSTSQHLFGFPKRESAEFSAYQLGRIYKNEHNSDSALYWFDRVVHSGFDSEYADMAEKEISRLKK